VITAVALERYRLANGHFPGALEALVPQFISPLPNDVLTGEPYKYRLTDDSRFVLYSVGWDEKDDGGVPGKTVSDDRQGDWVWRYAANQSPPFPNASAVSESALLPRKCFCHLRAY